MIEIIEKPQDSKRKELEEKIRIYKKNNKALCDMLVLGLYTFKNNLLNYSGDVIFYQLAETFLRDLEDSEVKVQLIANSIESLFKEDEKEFDKIEKELEENGYNDLRDKFLYEYTRAFNLKLEYDHSYKSRYERSFNFIRLLCRNSLDWTSEFLISDIDISTRINFLAQIISTQSRISSATHNFDYLLNHKGAGYNFNRTSEKVKKEKIDELIKALNKKIKLENKMDLFMKFISNNENYLNWIIYLQEKGLLDFTDLRGKFDIEGYEVKSSCCIYLLKHELVDSFKSFYELSDYLKIPSEIRDNDDIYFIRNINAAKIPEFISLSNFIIDEGKVRLIARRIKELKKENDYVNPSCSESIKITIGKICSEIENAIIHKAKNKEEYKTMCKYIEIFRECSSYEEQYIKQQTEIQELEDKRKEFVGVIKNISENLMETVPARKRIRDINFSNNP